MTGARPISRHRVEIDLPDAEATDALGTRLAADLRGGDTLLLSGPIGAGKSHLARAVIRALLQRADAPPEEIPSPTYTLVQTYLAGETEIWHVDLYRVGDPAEVYELGLDEAFGSAVCLVEWPDRLGSTIPTEALTITLSAQGAGRRAALEAQSDRWAGMVGGIGAGNGSGDDPGR